MEELEKKKILEGGDGTVPDSVPEEEKNLEENPEVVKSEEQPVDTSATEELSNEEPETDGDGNVPAEPVSEEPVIENSEKEEPVPVVDENGTIETSIKYFTQDDVNDIVGKTRIDTRNKTFKYIYDRYGVKDEGELDNLIGNAQRYDTLKEETDNERNSWETERNERDSRLASMSEEIALMKSGIAPERYEDAKLILKGKGLEVNLDNIQAELESHPEWNPVKEEPVVEEKKEPVTRIVKLGNEKPAPVEEDEETQAMRLFKLR